MFVHSCTAAENDARYSEGIGRAKGSTGECGWGPWSPLLRNAQHGRRPKSVWELAFKCSRRDVSMVSGHIWPLQYVNALETSLFFPLMLALGIFVCWLVVANVTDVFVNAR